MTRTASAAPRRAGATGSRVLGRLLLDTGAIRDADLEAALAEQRRTRERLGAILVRHGTDAEVVARALADQLRLPYAAPPLSPSPAALRLVPRRLALRHRVVPVEASERALAVAMADPLNGTAIDDLQFQTGRRVEPRVAAPAVVDLALMEAYGGEAVSTLLTRLPGPDGAGRAQSSAAEDVGALRRASEAAPVIALVDHILARSVARRASDVHIEPAGDRLRVRVRVDGLLEELVELPGHTGAAVASRIKIMAGLDIAVKRRPQDGRTTVRVRDRRLGVRVSTLPVGEAEKLVLRLLDAGRASTSLEDVGLEGRVLERFRALLGRGHGLILVTGPTGSGKTTTLYAALGSVDRDHRNVITLEDPIEYPLPGAAQVQVHPRAGLTFANALRAVLRQDPDVVMVGEMRDLETVEVGLAAAMTGHLVLSTLHTNDAPGAVARLGEMGAARYLIAGGLIGVLAQRLVRRLCLHCRRRTESSHAAPMNGSAASGASPFEAVGCARCNGSGYRGRIAVYELLLVDTMVRELVLAGGSADAIRRAARTGGLRPLAAHARDRVAAGLTSLDEAAPLLALLAEDAPSCPGCGADVEASFRSCPGCGRALSRACACGATLREDWRYCAECGAGTDTGAGDGRGPKPPSATAR